MAANDEGGARRMEGVTILVLEDEPWIALDLGMALESVGAKVCNAFSVADANKFLSDEDVHGAILDVNLGSETCEPIAATLKERDLPFIIHSGDLDRNGELISSFGVEIVPKPARSRVVVETLAELL